MSAFQNICLFQMLNYHTNILDSEFCLVGIVPMVAIFRIDILKVEVLLLV